MQSKRPPVQARKVKATTGKGAKPINNNSADGNKRPEAQPTRIGLTYKEASLYSGLTVCCLRRAVRQGKLIPAIGGKAHLFLREDLLALLLEFQRQQAVRQGGAVTGGMTGVAGVQGAVNLRDAEQNGGVQAKNTIERDTT